MPSSRGMYPLTREQLDIWIAHTLSGDANWLVSQFIAIEGEIEDNLVEAAVRRVVDEAEPIRVSIAESNGSVTQSLREYRDWSLPRYDLRSYGDPEMQAYIIAAEELHEPMPLTGLLFRFAMLRIAEQRSLLFICGHHIVMDGSGLSLIGNRIADIYSASVSGTIPQYHTFGTLSDLISIESAYEESDEYAEDEKYWSGYSEPDDTTEFDTRPADVQQAFSGTMVFSPGTEAVIAEVSAARGIRRASVVLAACALLAARKSGATEVWLDFPVSKRTHPAARNIPGMLAGVVPLIVTVRAWQHFGDLCDQVDLRIREALAHGRYPVRRIHGSGRVRGSYSRSRVEVNLFPPFITRDFGAARAARVLLSAGPVPSFGFYFFVDDGALTLRTIGTGQLLPGFDTERIQRVLSKIVAAPDVLIGSIDLLDEIDHRELDAWGNRAILSLRPDPGKSIPAAFADQVAARPNETAVVFEKQSLTYRELEVSANRLAHHLRDRGVGAGDRVVLLLPRSLDTIVAILAVLKTGAAYVPIDTSYPAQRIRYIIGDAAPAVAVTTSELSARLADSGVSTVGIDDPEILACPTSPLPHPIPQSPAYLIYTSGTTGTPKGVTITHTDVSELLRAVGARIALEGRVWAQFHSYAFDVSVREIWGALLHGGHLVIVPETVVRSPADLLHLLSTEQVTVLSQTPSAFYALQEPALQDDSPDRPALDAVLFAGEALEPRRLRHWFDSGCHAPRLINMYGTTETTIDASFHEVTAEDVVGAASNIGGPLDNSAFFVLDRNLRRTPAGVRGELYIAGHSVSRGYHNRPALTATRFVANPFHPRCGRLYRTGDVVRWSSGGALEYLGRGDDQVKIRGYRIELGEVQAALAEAAGTDRTAVIAREDQPGDKRLIGYVAGDIDPHSVRSRMTERLPEFMVPTAIISVDTLPLTTNGKLDRRALPAPEFGSSTPYRAPTTPVETTLTAIYARILGVTRVGIDDSFFDLGGHSLLAMRVIAAIKSELDADIDIHTVFQTPTVSGLVEAVTAQKEQAGRMPRPALRRYSRDEFAETSGGRS